MADNSKVVECTRTIASGLQDIQGCLDKWFMLILTELHAIHSELANQGLRTLQQHNPYGIDETILKKFQAMRDEETHEIEEGEAK